MSPGEVIFGDDSVCHFVVCTYKESRCRTEIGREDRFHTLAVAIVSELGRGEDSARRIGGDGRVVPSHRVFLPGIFEDLAEIAPRNCASEFRYLLLS